MLKKIPIVTCIHMLIVTFTCISVFLDACKNFIVEILEISSVLVLYGIMNHVPGNNFCTIN